MRDNSFAVKMNRGGELLHEHRKDYIRDKYKVDSPFLWSSVTVILLVSCVGIDVSFFHSLFSKISFEDPAMLWLMVAGLAFGADVVAVYAGILAKRIKQGLSKDKLILGMLIFVPVLTLIMNGILRYTTISLTNVDGTVDAASIALCVVAIVVPVFTSLGNFAVSFLTYDPLAYKMRLEEMAIDDFKDFCRRLEIIREECELFDAEKLKKMDHAHLLNARKELINDALVRSAEARVKLMEYLGDPTSTNVLSKSRCDEIFDRLEYELKALERTCRETESFETKKLETEESGNDNEDVITFPEVNEGGFVS